MKICVLRSLTLVILSLSVGSAAFAQRPGRGGGGGGYPPPVTRGGNGGGYDNRGSRPNQNPPPVYRGNDSRGNNGGYNNGGYRPSPSAPIYNPGRPGPVVRGNDRPNRGPIVVRRYDNDDRGRRNAGYVGNRVVYRDRYDAGRGGIRVRTYYDYNNRMRERYYRPMNVWGINFYVYNSRFDARYYSRFPNRYVNPYNNYWFYSTDSWYYRYSNYYPYRTTYSAPSQWLLDYYYRDLLRNYQQELIEQQAGVYYQNQIIQSQIQMNTRVQLENQIQQTMYNSQAVSVEYSLRDPNHLYVVSEELTVLDQNGYSCSITRGDVLRANGYAQGSSVASMQVVSSKDESCDAGSNISLSVDQLQEFENSMAVVIDDGLDAMSNDQYLRSTLNP